MAGGNGSWTVLADILDQVYRLANAVGVPGSALLVFIAFGSFPKWGMFTRWAEVWKENRIDDKRHREKMMQLQNKQRGRKDYLAPPPGGGSKSGKGR